MTNEIYGKYIAVLEEELIPAMGCTEPIAIAYAAALARKHLKQSPERVKVEVSGNIIKNVKSVIVPNTGGRRGIEAAAAAGIVAGDAQKELKVIAEVTEQEVLEIQDFLNQVPIEVCYADSRKIFDIMVSVFAAGHTAYVRICEYHTNVVEIREDDHVVFEKEVTADASENLTDRAFMNVEDIVEFANTVEIKDVQTLLDTQIKCNTEIAQEGLKNNYGANIGKVLAECDGDSIKNRAKAAAAAGSDARMNGCEMPVVINSGSGNQGITASVPVIEYAKELGVSQEKMYRALVLSNLLTIHLKTGIGRLSAYCGVVSAGCASGAGIAYLYGGDRKVIAHTLVNALAITSGIICDGAKASCAAKIATSVDAGILGYLMYQKGQQFYDGDGIVSKGVENTIHNVGRLARLGMAGTDEEILKIMTQEKHI